MMAKDQSSTAESSKMEATNRDVNSVDRPVRNNRSDYLTPGELRLEYNHMAKERESAFRQMKIMREEASKKDAKLLKCRKRMKTYKRLWKQCKKTKPHADFSISGECEATLVLRCSEEVDEDSVSSISL